MSELYYFSVTTYIESTGDKARVKLSSFPQTIHFRPDHYATLFSPLEFLGFG